MATVTALRIPADHPAFAGHFPGAPMLPGVVLLDAALREIELEGTYPCSRWQISAAKFLSPAQPGEPLTFEREQLPDGSIRFAIHSLERIVAKGVLVPHLPPPESGDGE